MKPHEQNSQHEALPKLGAETIPAPQFGEKYNGMYASEAEFKEAEAKYSLNTVSLETPTTYPIATAAEESNNEVIDVEAREVVINPESPDETEDIAELIENNDEIMIGDEKLVFTSELRALALGVLASLDQIISTPEDELPESIDWLPFIMSEPGYDHNYDYTLLKRLLTAQYNRKRALALTRHTLNPLRLESTPLRHSAGESNNPTDEESPDNPNEVAQIENDNILKIEYDNPGQPDAPALEYEDNPPVLPNEATPGRSPG